MSCITSAGKEAAERESGVALDEITVLLVVGEAGWCTSTGASVEDDAIEFCACGVEEVDDAAGDAAAEDSGRGGTGACCCA